MDRPFEPFQFDEELFLLLHFDGSQRWDDIFTLISSREIWIPLYFLLVYMIYRELGWRKMLLSLAFILLAITAADQISNFFKDCLPKLRPTHYDEFEGMIVPVYGYKGGEYGTVSAHAANSFVVIISSWLYIRKKWVTYTLLFWGLTVSYSRIYLGVHYPTDIIFGIILGILIPIGTYFLYKLTLRKLEKLKRKRIKKSIISNQMKC